MHARTSYRSGSRLVISVMVKVADQPDVVTFCLIQKTRMYDPASMRLSSGMPLIAETPPSQIGSGT